MSSFVDRKKLSPEEVETGETFAPKFDASGVMPVVTTDAKTGEVVMLAYMNEEALVRTLETGEAHYWSRSRQSLWRKGETSGNTQKVVDIKTDCDQDAIWLIVEMGGLEASCHVGYRSCFFRSLKVSDVSPASSASAVKLRITEGSQIFDPKDVYKKT